MHARTEAQLQRMHRRAHDADDAAWTARRDGAEPTEQRNLPPPLPRRSAEGSPSIATVAAAPFHSLTPFDPLESGLLEEVPRRRHPWPVLLFLLICGALVGTAFVRELVAEAEQQARMERVLAEIRALEAQHHEGTGATASTLALGRPDAAIPKSETLAAFARMSATTTPDGVHAKSPARRALVHRPSVRAARVDRDSPARRTPAARAVPHARPAISTVSPAEREEQVNLSDDPLFGL